MISKKSIPPRRTSIVEVSDRDLEEAVMDMVNRLHVPGRGEGYDLYAAVLQEKKKAISSQKLMYDK